MLPFCLSRSTCVFVVHIFPARLLFCLDAGSQGISNEAENTQRQEHLRPRRALTKDSETGQLVLTSFSMEAAEAQARHLVCVVFRGDPGQLCGMNQPVFPALQRNLA